MAETAPRRLPWHATAAGLLLGHHIALVGHPCADATPHARPRARGCAAALLLRAGFSPWRARRQELLAWTFAALGCGWPEPPGAGAQRGRFTRVAVLADPQLTDRTSYRTAASGPLLVVRLRVRA